MFQGNLITKEFIKKLIRSDLKLYYSSPEMNEHLYLHYKSFEKIENLEEFTNLKVLYLEANCFKTIEGLDCLTELRAFLKFRYLQENQIIEISGLNALVNLHTLNLSDNLIAQITGLDKLVNLEAIQLKRNQIGRHGINDLEGLLSCQALSLQIQLILQLKSSLDLSYNFIETEEILYKIFQKMPKLRVLYLSGNPFIKSMKNYRKIFIYSLPTLKYLDDLPIFEDEHRYCEAFERGGLEEEKLERKKVKFEKEEKQKQNLGQYKSVVEKYQKALNKMKEEKSQQNDNKTIAKTTQSEFDTKELIENAKQNQEEISKENDETNYLDEIE